MTVDEPCTALVGAHALDEEGWFLWVKFTRLLEACPLGLTLEWLCDLPRNALPVSHRCETERGLQLKLEGFFLLYQVEYQD